MMVGNGERELDLAIEELQEKREALQHKLDELYKLRVYSKVFK